MWQTSKISHEKTYTWLGKGNLKRETESRQIATQSNAIRTNYVKAKIGKMQQNVDFVETETKRLHNNLSS